MSDRTDEEAEVTAAASTAEGMVAGFKETRAMLGLDDGPSDWLVLLQGRRPW